MYLQAHSVVLTGGMQQHKWRQGWVAVGLLYLALVFVGWAFGVGCSRVIDNKHHPADVAAGWLLGAGVAVLFAARAVGLRSAVVFCCDRNACALGS